MSRDITATQTLYVQQRSSPCIKLSMQDTVRIESKILSPDSKRRLIARKPQCLRNNQSYRSRRQHEDTREFANFYSPTSNRTKQKCQLDTSIILQRQYGNMSCSNILGLQRDDDSELNTSTVRYTQQRSPTNVYQKPRLVARILPATQIKLGNNVTTSNFMVLGQTKLQQTNLKKIQILQIQLEAIDLQNSRLKQHITLLRSNNQQLKNKLQLLQRERPISQQRKCSWDSSMKQNINNELDRLKNTCQQLIKSLSRMTEEYQQERIKFNKSIIQLQQSQKKMRQTIVQLESILAINRRQHSMLKSTNQQLTLRMGNLNRQLSQMQATQRQRSCHTKHLLKKQRLEYSINNHRQQYDEREDELFELSPERQ